MPIVFIITEQKCVSQSMNIGNEIGECLLPCATIWLQCKNIWASTCLQVEWRI